MKDMVGFRGVDKELRLLPLKILAGYEMALFIAFQSDKLDLSRER